MTRARKSRSFGPKRAVAATPAIVAFFLLSGTTAQAASSPWQDIGGGEVRLVAIKDPAQGTLSGVVEVKLEKGWKTYWRAPGSSGIPPEFDFSGSSAIEVDSIHFPSPIRIEAGESVFYGYKDTVAFPFYGLAGLGETELRLDLLIGVCEEICIPATASLAIASDALNISDPKAQMQIMLAETFLPEGPNDNLRIASFARDGNRLELRIQSEAAEADIRTVVWPRDGGWISDPAKAVRQADGSYLSAFDLPEGVDVPDTASGVWSFALLLQEPEDQSVKKTIEGRISAPGD